MCFISGRVDFYRFFVFYLFDFGFCGVSGNRNDIEVLFGVIYEKINVVLVIYKFLWINGRDNILLVK